MLCAQDHLLSKLFSGHCKITSALFFPVHWLIKLLIHYI
uniref:Uncharacterized protein n=1 Tax=Arundo donax TaxID=35708 RepID=A0A0A9G267_ARUDO